MQKINYQKELDSLLLSLGKNQNSDNKKTLLLHACCGPCSSYVLEYLSDFFDITVFFYNPNIYPQEEYFRRLNELKKFYESFPVVKNHKVKLIEEKYIPEEFYSAIQIKQNPELAFEKEKGVRCYRCYEFRLKRAYEFANKNHFDYFCTTLSISPFKDAEKINEIGQKLEQHNVLPKWLFSDFKKKGGFLRSLELSKEYSLYRQQYCGCIYSSQNK